MTRGDRSRDLVADGEMALSGHGGSPSHGVGNCVAVNQLDGLVGWNDNKEYGWNMDFFNRMSLWGVIVCYDQVLMKPKVSFLII